VPPQAKQDDLDRKTTVLEEDICSRAQRWLKSKRGCDREMITATLFGGSG
jgi:hypothetical protein